MAQKVLSLPLRIRPSITESSLRWTCRRCLATQQSSTTSTTPHEQQSTRPNETAAYDATLPFAQRGYRLGKTDYFLKKPLAHRIPPQYLEHSTSELLPEGESKQREMHVSHKQIIGVVVSAGKMDKTVKVRVAGQRWEKKIGKYFASYTSHLVHDPNSSLVLGDVVSLHKLRVSTSVRHVVASIVAPFGKSIESRPPIPSPDERLAKYKEKRFAKLWRRSLRRQAALGDTEAIAQLRKLGLDPGEGVDSDLVGMDGQKGQKLQAGVLPGGKHKVGKINARAMKNKEQANKLEEQAVDNLRKADVAANDLEGAGLESTPATSTITDRGRND